MELEEGLVIERYSVIRKLGEGGMASVYLVQHQKLGSLHALKMLKIASEKVQKRLLQEGRIQGQLKHPNVVPVTDTITFRGLPGLVSWSELPNSYHRPHRLGVPLHHD
ncbi:MAG: hypothetical protein HN348_06465 [Proteobacteria bacterium]|jgi:serine/threonine protein kinase|nr:hypothetical protein [Pseudomonadota bacterium]